MRTRLIAAVGAAAIAASAVAPAVLAGGPTRDFLPAWPIDLAAGDTCAFPVRLDPLVNTEYAETFTDESGGVVRQLVGGRLIMEVTNLDTGSSTVVNVSGPGVFTPHADGTLTVILRGNSLVFAPGVLELTRGTMVVEVDSTGTVTSVTQVAGTSQDLCAVLG